VVAVTGVLLGLEVGLEDTGAVEPVVGQEADCGKSVTPTVAQNSWADWMVAARKNY
jgi:hypothetical protein